MVVDARAESEALMSQVREQAVSFLSEQIGFVVHPFNELAEKPLPDLVSSVPIAGALEGTILLRATESLATEMMHRLLGCDVSDEERPRLVLDTLDEVLNMIVGGTTQSLDQIGLPIEIFPPVRVEPGETLGRVAEECSIETESGPIVLMYVSNG